MTTLFQLGGETGGITSRLGEAEKLERDGYLLIVTKREYRYGTKRVGRIKYLLTTKGMKQHAKAQNTH